MSKGLHFETLAVHAGHTADPTTGAVTLPIHLSTTFERAEDGSFPHGFIYSRTDNPNRKALEAALAALEMGADAAAFASGSAATAAIFQALSPGDHVIAPNDAYYNTGLLLRDTFGRWGLTASFVDMTNVEEVAAAVRPSTKLFWVETPSNPLLQITDLRAVADIAHRAGARVACDNTWATPALTQPLGMGIDLVVHSTTKYLGGHSDVIGGAVITRVADDFFARIRSLQQSGGAVPSPFDCWLVMRGIRSLPWRMRAHCANARAVAEFLAQHRAVAAVHYPGLPTDKGHVVAAQQMRDFGGMLSFEVRGAEREAHTLTASLKIFTRATSLGGSESLIEHRASVEGPTTRAPASLLRVSVGLEHPDDLIADLQQGLDLLA